MKMSMGVLATAAPVPTTCRARAAVADFSPTPIVGGGTSAFRGSLVQLRPRRTRANTRNAGTTARPVSTRASLGGWGKAAARDLYEGVEGPDVLSLQQLMLSQGHLRPTDLTGYFGPATKAAVAQWQRYHELPSTGFWGPASRSTVKKLGLHKLTTKATSAVDDPMGVNAARPRPLVPWSTVPVSTTVTSKQLAASELPAESTTRLKVSVAAPPAMPTPTISSGDAALTALAGTALLALAAFKKLGGGQGVKGDGRGDANHNDAGGRHGRGGSSYDRGTPDPVPAWARAPPKPNQGSGRTRRGSGSAASATAAMGPSIAAVTAKSHTPYVVPARGHGGGQLRPAPALTAAAASATAEGGFPQFSKHHAAAQRSAVRLPTFTTTAAVATAPVRPPAPRIGGDDDGLPPPLPPAGSDETIRKRASLENTQTVYEAGLAAFREHQAARAAAAAASVQAPNGAPPSNEAMDKMKEDTALLRTQVNHGYRLTDELAVRVAELEKQVKNAGVVTAPSPPTAPPGDGMAPGRLQDAVQAAANAEAKVEALQTRLDDALGPLTANYQMLAEAVAAWDGVAPQAAAAKQLLASPAAGPSAEVLTARVMDVERAMEELKQQVASMAAAPSPSSQSLALGANPTGGVAGSSSGKVAVPEVMLDLSERLDAATVAARLQPVAMAALSEVQRTLTALATEVAAAASAAARSHAAPANRQLSGDAPADSGGLQGEGLQGSMWENLTSMMQMIGKPARGNNATMMDDTSLTAMQGRLDAMDATLADIAAVAEGGEGASAVQLSAAVAPLRTELDANAIRLAALEASLADYATVEAMEALGERMSTLESKQGAEMDEVHARLNKLERLMQQGGEAGDVNQRLNNLEEESAEALKLDAGIMQQMAALEEAVVEATLAQELKNRLAALEASLMEAATGHVAESLAERVAALENALALPEAPELNPVAPPPPPPPAPPVEEDSWFEPLPVPEAEPAWEQEPQAPLSAPPPGRGALWRHEYGREVLLQGFHWDSSKHDWYKIVMSKLDDVKAAGFTGIWLPPPSDSLAPQGYLPRDLYKLDTKYGSEQELRTLIGMIHERGMHAIADIVVNHRCATAQGAGGQWNKWEGVKMDWGEWAVCAGSFAGQGNQQSGQDFHAAPNLDHSNDTVRNDICEWLRWLRNDVGFDSLRLDFSKGYGGKFAKAYIEAAAPEFAVGEYWDTCSYGDNGLEYDQNGHRQGIVNWIDQTEGQGTAFDFTTKGILQEACRNTQFWRLADRDRKPPGLMGVWPSHAVTFVDNHDTGSTQGHWPFPNDRILLGYCYLLTHPGTPFVMWDHLFDWGEEVGKAVREMVACRQECDIHSRSPVHIKHAVDDCYAAVTEGDAGVLAMKIGPGSWAPEGAGWRIVSFGKDYAIWIQS